MTSELGGAAKALRTPRAAALAGIVFSVLLVGVLAIIRQVVPADAVASTWLEDPTQRRLVVFALNLVPFAGISFLWFVGTVRDHLGVAEDRFFATVFLGSGLLFVAMLFVGAAMSSGLIAGAEAASSAAERSVWRTTRQTSSVVITVYALRMAAVFIVSTTSMTYRLAMIPRWLAVYGFATAVVLLLTLGTLPWVEVLFPIWVFVFSVHLLRTRFRAEPKRGSDV